MQRDWLYGSWTMVHCIMLYKRKDGYEYYSKCRATLNTYTNLEEAKSILKKLGMYVGILIRIKLILVSYSID